MNHTSRFTFHVSRNTQYTIRSILACVLLFASVSPVLAQSDITFTATVDRATLSSDQLLTLQLTLAGTFRSSGRPALPALDGFAVVGSSQSSQFSMINGKTSSQVNYIYQLQPTKTGALTIPAISIEVGGQTYQTQPVTVEVTAGAAPPAQQSGGTAPSDLSAPADLGAQNFYVEAEVDNAAPVVGQQIVYTFRLYQAVNFYSQPSLDWPEFTGFVGYDLSPNSQFNQVIGQRQYLITEVRRALFPTATGDMILNPAKLSVPGDFFNQGFELSTNAVTVSVQALPAGAPDGFAGAVGQFEITAEVEPTQGRVNEPVTLRVRVKGAGNINALPDPTALSEDAFPGWRVYDPKVTTNVGQQGSTIQGEKVFERLLVPKTEGTLTIPGFNLVFFDPGGMYRTASTAPIAVPVAAGEAAAPGPVVIGDGKQDVVVLGSDIRHIKAAPPVLMSARAPLLASPLYWVGWFLPLLAVAGTWGWTRRQQTLAQNVAYARTLRARKLARKRLAEAEKQLHQDADAAYAAVARALTHYLGDKANLPPAGFTRDAIEQTLAARGVPPALIARVLACLDWADSGRFAPGAAGRSVADLVREAETVIAELEGVVD